MASAKKIRVGTKWYSPAEYRDLLKDEELILQNTCDFRAISDFDSLLAKLKKASAANPASVDADFIMGMLFAFIPRPAADAKEGYIRRSAADAEVCFEKCAQRLLDYESDLTDAERANLAACYNNLALARVRQRKYTEAMRSWQRCLEVSPPSDAVLHNIGQFDAIVAQSLRGDLSGIRFRLSPQEESQLRRLMGIVRGIPTPYETVRGWRYMPLVSSDLESEYRSTLVKADVGSAATPIADLVPAGGGTGFAVGKGLFLTNRHVVTGSSGFKIRRETDDYTASHPAALVIASDNPKLDLALLKCDLLDVSALKLDANDPTLSSEIRTLGFPEFFELGINIKVGSGIVSSLPPLRGLPKSEWEDFFMHDALTAPGSSGGPILNRSGLVVGVHTGAFMDKFKVAVAVSQIAPFLRPHVPDLQVVPRSKDDSKSWEVVVDDARKSTVHILGFGKPDRHTPIIEANQSLRQFDDRWCMACYGNKRLDCPERQCRFGTVATFREDVVTLSNGVVAKRRTPIRVNCPTCNGRGVIDCGYCSNGIDPRFAK